MKRLSLVLNVVLFALVAVLFYLHFSEGKATPAAGVNRDIASGGGGTSLSIAYVNVDSLEAHYGYFQKKREELSKKQDAIQNDLSSRAKALQDEVAQLQKKAPTMTQSEGEAAQRSILQKQQALQQREQDLREKFMQEQQQFNLDLHNRLDAFLKTYNADKHYTFILSYAEGVSDILYKDSTKDITADVIRGLNAAEAASK